MGTWRGREREETGTSSVYEACICVFEHKSLVYASKACIDVPVIEHRAGCTPQT